VKTTNRPMLTIAVLACAALAGCGGASTKVETEAAPERSPEPTPPVDLTVNEDGDDAVVEVEAPPAGPLARGLAAYDAGDYETAAIQLDQAMATGGDESAAVDQAEFFLAKALYHLVYEIAALETFASVTRRPGHAYHSRVLPWLSVLLLDREHVYSFLASGLYDYEPAQIDRALADQPAETRDHLYLLAGRFSIGVGDLDRAHDLLSRVSAGSRFWPRAKILDSTAYMRERKARQALRPVWELLRGIGSDSQSDAETRRWRDLAWITTGRIEFTISTQPDEPARFDQAVAAYNQIEETSDLYHTALFEKPSRS
jgi:hypothetical protein